MQCYIICEWSAFESIPFVIFYRSTRKMTSNKYFALTSAEKILAPLFFVFKRWLGFQSVRQIATLSLPVIFRKWQTKLIVIRKVNIELFQDTAQPIWAQKINSDRTKIKPDWAASCQWCFYIQLRRHHPQSLDNRRSRVSPYIQCCIARLMLPCQWIPRFPYDCRNFIIPQS